MPVKKAAAPALSVFRNIQCSPLDRNHTVTNRAKRRLLIPPALLASGESRMGILVPQPGVVIVGIARPEIAKRHERLEFGVILKPMRRVDAITRDGGPLLVAGRNARFDRGGKRCEHDSRGQ